jgi:hypothetical protein
MATKREDAAAVLLPSGKVLVAGGSNTASLTSAELYDPSTNTWTSAGDMVTPRDTATATLLPNGKVLVAGGDNGGGAVASAERYDPATNSWSSAGSMGHAHSDHTATLLPNGKVLVVGGGTGAELYDPATNGWAAAGAPHATGGRQTATLLPNGQVLATGGFFVKSAELYNPGTNTWTDTADMHYVRARHTATLLPDGKVLVVGGEADAAPLPDQTSELYDAAAGTWSLTGNLVSRRSDHTATLLSTGKVLVAGGSDGFTASAELYDPATGLWAAQPPMLNGRCCATASLLQDGRVLMAGGSVSGSPGDQLTEAELYTPDFPAVGTPAALLATASVSKLSIKPSIFRAASSGPSASRAKRRRHKVGTTVSYTDSQAGTATLTVLRPAKGRRVRKGKKRVCAKPTRKNRKKRRCTRYVKVGSFTHKDVAGKNRLHFSGRIRHRKLRPGRYRLQVTAKGPNGKVSKALVKRFRIVRR